jgi:hypothetical protein
VLEIQIFCAAPDEVGHMSSRSCVGASALHLLHDDEAAKGQRAISYSYLCFDLTRHLLSPLILPVPLFLSLILPIDRKTCTYIHQ